jgi:hypothetical protein
MLSVKLAQSSSMGQPLWWREGKIFHVLFYITATNVDSPGNANPYVAGGDTLDLTQLFNTASSAPGMLLPTFEEVADVRIKSARPVGAANNGNLFVYEYAPNPTAASPLAAGTMQVFTGAAAQTGLTELTPGNYPAGVLNDTIFAEALFVMP